MYMFYESLSRILLKSILIQTTTLLKWKKLSEIETKWTLTVKILYRYIRSPTLYKMFKCNPESFRQSICDFHGPNIWFTIRNGFGEHHHIVYKTSLCIYYRVNVQLLKFWNRRFRISWRTNSNYHDNYHSNYQHAKS